VARGGGTADNPAVLQLLRGLRHDRMLDEMRLEPLGAEALVTLVRSVAPEADLSRVAAESGGNPFFAIQFLSALHEQHLIEFDRSLTGWRWDMPRIEAYGFTGNVAEFMLGKLTRMSPEARHALQCFACLGTRANTNLPTIAPAERLADLMTRRTNPATGVESLAVQGGS